MKMPILSTLYLEIISNIHKGSDTDEGELKEAISKVVCQEGIELEMDSILTVNPSPYNGPVGALKVKVVGLKPFSKGFATLSSTSIILLDKASDADPSSIHPMDEIVGMSSLQILGRCGTQCMSFNPSKYPYSLRSKVEEISKIIFQDQDSRHDSFAVCSFEFLDLHQLFHGDWIWLSARGSHKRRLCQVFASQDMVHLNKYYRRSPSSILHVNSMLLYNILSPSDHQRQLHYTGSPHKSDTLIHLTMEIQQVDYNRELEQKAVSLIEFKRRACPFDGLYFDAACKSLTTLLNSQKLWVGVGDIVCVDVNITEAHYERLLKSHIVLSPESMAKIDEIVHIAGSTSTIPFYFEASKVGRDTSTIDGEETDCTLGFIDPSSTKVVISPDRFTPSLPLEYPLEMLNHSSSSGTDMVQEDFIDLVSASLNPELTMSPSILLLTPDATSKTQTVDYVTLVARKTGLELIEIDCNVLMNETAAVISAVFESAAEKALLCSPSVLLFNRIDIVAGKKSSVVTNIKNGLQSVYANLLEGNQSIILVATASKESTHDLDAGVLGVFQTTLTVTVPSQAERAEIVQDITKRVRMEDRYLDHTSVAVSTAGLGVDDLQACFANAASCCYDRASKIVDQVEKESGIDRNELYGLIGLSNQDLNKALGKARAHHSETIGAAKIPKVYWSDIGGLEHVKKTILETIQLPMSHPELFQSGAKKRSGVLLYGPPGTGKTLIAKAVATSLSLNFLSVKGPELLNMYIGESEHNVRRVFQKARDARPCIIFFDEMESVAPARGEKGDSGGVMDRIVSQLLAEIDGMSEGGSGDIFVIGATNRPDLLDPALLRPGRFDKMLYLGVCPDHKSQTSLLKALTRKMELTDDFDLHMVAQKCPLTLTGADLYALCTDANLKAISRVIKVVDYELEEWNKSGPHPGHPSPTSMPYFLDHVCEAEKYLVKVTLADFEDALKELTPSLGRAELERYERLRDKFEGPPPPSIDRKGKGKMM